MKYAAMLCLALLAGTAHAAEPALSKAACDALLNTEVRRLEDSFARTRDAWEKTVAQRFSDHTELTPAQMRTARATFDEAVVQLATEHLKAVALPGMYRMMLAIPQYDVGVCAQPAQMRALGDKAITGFLMKLTALLPLVESSVSAARLND